MNIICALLIGRVSLINSEGRIFDRRTWRYGGNIELNNRTLVPVDTSRLDPKLPSEAIIAGLPLLANM